MKIIAQNRKAYHNFAVEEEFEAGLMLLGSEVKALREGRVNINDSYIVEEKGELVMINCLIGPWKGAQKFMHDENRRKKILLHKREAAKLLGKVKIKGYSLIVLKIYFNKRNLVKVLVGLAKGKKLYDKRESIKQRDEKRRQAREGV